MRDDRLRAAPADRGRKDPQNSCRRVILIDRWRSFLIAIWRASGGESWGSAEALRACLATREMSG